MTAGLVKIYILYFVFSLFCAKYMFNEIQGRVFSDFVVFVVCNNRFDFSVINFISIKNVYQGKWYNYNCKKERKKVFNP
jgi:hypothetical protein